jgi:hypothetical protein
MLVPVGVALVGYGHLSGKWLRWTCPVRALLHLPCPTCGMTTATRALLRLDLATALHENPLAPVVVPFVAAFVALELGAYVVTGRFDFFAARAADAPGVRKTKSAVRIAGIAMCVALFVVWVARFFGAFGGPLWS